MRILLWKMRMRERIADLCQTLSHRMDPARPVVVRARQDISGDDWEVWADGQPVTSVVPSRRSAKPSAEFKPRWRS